MIRYHYSVMGSYSSFSNPPEPNPKSNLPEAPPGAGSNPGNKDVTLSVAICMARLNCGPKPCIWCAIEAGHEKGRRSGGVIFWTDEKENVFVICWKRRKWFAQTRQQLRQPTASYNNWTFCLYNERNLFLKNPHQICLITQTRTAHSHDSIPLTEC